jgi:hypothetical protein
MMELANVLEKVVSLGWNYLLADAVRGITTATKPVALKDRQVQWLYAVNLLGGATFTLLSDIIKSKVLLGGWVW